MAKCPTCRKRLEILGLTMCTSWNPYTFVPRRSHVYCPNSRVSKHLTEIYVKFKPHPSVAKRLACRNRLEVLGLLSDVQYLYSIISNPAPYLWNPYCGRG